MIESKDCKKERFLVVNVLCLLAFLVVLVAVFFGGVNDAEAYTCRNASVKHAFDKQEGYPHGRDGYIVDHICALAQGGIDDVKNMQYQSTVESHKKDRIENTAYGAALFCTPENSTPTRQVYNCKRGVKK